MGRIVEYANKICFRWKNYRLRRTLDQRSREVCHDEVSRKRRKGNRSRTIQEGILKLSEERKDWKSFRAVVAAHPCNQGKTEKDLDGLIHPEIHCLVSIIPEDWEAFLRYNGIDPKQSRYSITVDATCIICKASSNSEL